MKVFGILFEKKLFIVREKNRDMALWQLGIHIEKVVSGNTQILFESDIADENFYPNEIVFSCEKMESFIKKNVRFFLELKEFRRKGITSIETPN